MCYTRRVIFIDLFVNKVFNDRVHNPTECLMSNDKKLITDLGGPAKVADLLGYTKHGGVQRVQNWMTRGIPSKVKLDNPALFQPGAIRRATDLAPARGHGGRQPASPHNILDTIPIGAVIVPSRDSKD